MTSQLTTHLIERSGGLLLSVGEVADWTGKNFMMFNTGSVEIEVAEFLYSMVRLTKPMKVLDTGTHFGVSALYMAEAVSHNGFGQVLSMEIDEFYAKKAQELWRNCGVEKLITQFHGKSLEYKTEDMFDFMLLDTEPNIRFAELQKYMPHLNPGGYVFIHDLHRHMSQQPHEMYFGWPFGELPTEIKNWVKDDELRPIHFPTPRGFMGFYKPAPDDYRWR